MTLRLLFFVAFSLPLFAKGPAAGVTESQPGLLKKAKYSPEKAMAQVRAFLPQGVIEEAQIEIEHGSLIYSFDVSMPGEEGIVEMNISALTGILISRKHEGPVQVAAEADEDRKAAAVKPLSPTASKTEKAADKKRAKAARRKGRP